MNNIPLLQPERDADEGFSAYKERRESAHEYVTAILGGTVFWNPTLQGTYRSDARQAVHGRAKVRAAYKAENRAHAKETRELAAFPPVTMP